MASIHRKGDGWVVRWRNPGESKNHSTPCPSHEVAMRVELKARNAHALGLPYLGPKAEAAALAARRVDLRELATEYLRSRRRAGKSEGYVYQTNIALTLFLQTLSEDDEAPIDGALLTSAALNGYYDHLREDRGCSLRTARDRVNYIERWWAWLGDSETWAERIGRPRRIEMAQPPAMDDPEAPTWREMDLTIACATGWYAHLMTVSRYTGLRAEDQALLLKRTDIDAAAGTLRVRPELGKTRAEKRGRTVPVSPILLSLLDAWPEDPEGWLVHVPKFSDRHAGPPKRRAWNAQASGAWRRAGVRPEVWDTQTTDDGHRKNGHPLHAFRKGFITGLLAAGAPLEDVQFLVGHKSALGGVTVERYMDPKMVRKLRAAVELVPPPSLVVVTPISGGGCRAG